MSQINFEPPLAAASDSELRHQLSLYRKQLVEQASKTAEHSILGLPSDLGNDYVRRREQSKLGRVFRLANTLNDYIDAIVLVGAREDFWGIRVLWEACCDPYHNELTRAQRGSKPRLYFIENPLDTDALDSLLSRLNFREGIEASARFSVIYRPGDDGQTEAIADMRCLMSRLSTELGSESSAWLARLFTIFHRQESGSRLSEFELQWNDQFDVTAEPMGPWGVFTSCNLLPAAYLGLDCMKWLVGADEVMRQFVDDQEDQSVVTRMAATSISSRSAHASESMAPPSVLILWDRCLETLGIWYQDLRRQAGLLVPEILVLPRDRSRLKQLHPQQWIDELVIETQRADPILVDGQSLDSGRQQLRNDLRQDWIESRNLLSQTTLPCVDMQPLGAWMQSKLIATQLEQIYLRSG